ncbi:TetR/AcrR family transcriptional regulator [Nocardia sp. NPDC127606]|uniref:TetR/AcrR family transcriptional regulator n=1 Tax=Nocardia sp. NPDC127606 TaxID=3345406 RepID=UPI00362FE972
MARRDDLLRQVQHTILNEDSPSLTMIELTERLPCSKATLYRLAMTKEQLVVLATKHFFTLLRESANQIEATVATETDPKTKILAYPGGVANAMRRNSHAFSEDMVGFAPTAEISARNTARAAERVREMIDDGIASAQVRATDGTSPPNSSRSPSREFSPASYWNAPASQPQTPSTNVLPCC